MRMSIKLNPQLCKGCGFCVRFCPAGALAMGTWPLWPLGPQERNAKGNCLPVFTPGLCNENCLTCAQMCPEGAITIVEEGVRA